VRVGGTPTEALTAVLDHGDVVLCTRAWAGVHRLHWRPVGVPALRRSYAWTVRPGSSAPSGLDTVLPAVATALHLAAP